MQYFVPQLPLSHLPVFCLDLFHSRFGGCTPTVSCAIDVSLLRWDTVGSSCQSDDALIGRPYSISLSWITVIKRCLCKLTIVDLSATEKLRHRETCQGSRHPSQGRLDLMPLLAQPISRLQHVLGRLPCGRMLSRSHDPT